MSGVELAAALGIGTVIGLLLYYWAEPYIASYKIRRWLRSLDADEIKLWVEVSDDDEAE